MTLIFRGYTQHSKADGYEYVEANVLLDDAELIRGLDCLSVDVHEENRRAGWWTDLSTGADLLETRNRGEMLMLAVTELDEAQDAREIGAYDDKLPQYLGFYVELADCAIRLLDTIGAEHRRYGSKPLTLNHPVHYHASVAREYRESVTLRGRGEDLIWVVGALSKALDEGYRKDRAPVARYWLSVALFRIIALAVHEDIPLFEIIEAKREFNRSRADHKIENRVKDGGKKC